MIRDDLGIETESFEDCGEEHGSDSRGVNGFLGRAEDYPLSKPMVDHDQKGIKTIGRRKVSDQITGDLLEWVGARGWDREKWGLGWVSVDFVLLASSTTKDIAANIGHKTQPPEF